MNPTKNPTYKSMSKKALIRQLKSMEDAHLELFRAYQRAQRESVMNYGRLAVAIAASGGEITVTEDDIESLPEDLGNSIIHVDEPEEGIRVFRLEDTSDEEE